MSRTDYVTFPLEFLRHLVRIGDHTERELQKFGGIDMLAIELHVCLESLKTTLADLRDDEKASEKLLPADWTKITKNMSQIAWLINDLGKFEVRI